MAKKGKGRKDSKRDKKRDREEDSGSSDGGVATIETGSATDTVARAGVATAAPQTPDATIETGRPDAQTAFDAQAGGWRDIDKATLDTQLAEHSDNTQVTDPLQGKIERHDGPGVTEMYERASKYGVGKQGVDEFLFHRDNNDDAPPTSKPGNDPSWSSAGDGGTKGPTDAQLGLNSGTTGQWARDQLQDQDNKAAVGRELENAGIWRAGDSAQNMEKQRQEREALEADRRRAQEEAERKAEEAAEKAAKEAAEKAAKEAAEKAAKEAAEKAAAEKAAKEKKEKEEKEEKDKKYTDPDQDPGGSDVLPDALREAPRLLRDPDGAGISHLVRDGQDPPSVDDIDWSRRPGHETGEPDRDPDHVEVVLTPAAPGQRNAAAPIDYGNPLDANAPPPPGPPTGGGGGEADQVAAATIDTAAIAPAGAQPSAPAPQVAAGDDFSGAPPDAPMQDPGAVPVGGPPDDDDN